MGHECPSEVWKFLRSEVHVLGVTVTGEVLISQIWQVRGLEGSLSHDLPVAP